MVAAGLLVFLFGFFQLWPPLRLVIFGVRVRAEAIRAVKEKPGLPALMFTDDVQVRAQWEPHDRSYVFWNEFRFHTREGRLIETRAGGGSQVKPLYPLFDADGLPTTDWVCYDPDRPERTTFPLIISVWLAPCVLALAGLGCAIIGGVLLYWAGRPIKLPHLAATGGPGSAPKI
jgi:hypothetical protein